MRRSCWWIRGGKAEAFDFADISERVGKEEGLAWIEVDGDDEEALMALGEELDLHELAVEDARNGGQRTKAEEYPGQAFFAVRSGGSESMAFCGSGYLALVRPGGEAGEGLARKEAARRGDISEWMALRAWLDAITDRLAPRAEEIRKESESLAKEAFENGLSESGLKRLFAARERAAALREDAEPIAQVCAELARSSRFGVGKKERPYFRDTEDHARRIAEAMGKAERGMADAMQLALGRAVMEQSESTRKLAGWGAIIAVPTLVFSLYGMNFESMPELSFPMGYPLALWGTAAGSYALYRRLKRKGWV